MSESSHKGQELLKLWLSGSINYAQEQELFRLAEDDEMLREALEGYIGQEIYEAADLPVAASAYLQPAAAEQKPVSRLIIMRVAAAILLLVAAAAFLLRPTPDADSTLIVEQQDELEDAVDQVIATDDEEVVTDLTACEIGSAEENLDKVVPVAVELESKRDELPMQSPSLREDFSPKEELNLLVNGEGAAEVDLEDESVPVTAELKLLPDGEFDLSNEDGSDISPVEIFEDGPTESITDVTVILDEEPVETGIEPIALQFSDEEEGDMFQRETEKNAVEDDEDLITAYEIELKSGLSPQDALIRGSGSDSTGLDLTDIDARVQLADASGSSNRIDTNRVVDDVVITEYRIDKRDLLNPPISDFNSLVREKYKRKARPETGFYKYKQFLRSATGCLKDVYQSVDYLEEAVIKFRIFENGDIEFIELFGVPSVDCTYDVETSIVSGPKWNLEEPYEAIDIEIPFKVLHPYWF